MIPRSLQAAARKTTPAAKKPRLTAHTSSHSALLLLSLSDELVASILGHSSAKGLAFIIAMGCRQLWRVCKDPTYRTVWKSLCERLSEPWAVRSPLLERTLVHASAHAGGWRSLCAQKDAYDPRHFKLPDDAPTDWPTGRWYPLAPFEESGLYDALFEKTGAPRGTWRGAQSDEALSVFFLLDGSGSMTPCFRGIKRFIKNMIARLREPEMPSQAAIKSTVAFLQYNDYKVRNELAQTGDPEALNVPLRSEQLDTVMENWDKIVKLGGTTRTVHAVEAAERAVQAAPGANRKLIVLISDGVTDDWDDSIKQLLQIEEQDEQTHLLVVGVAACSYYEDEFPTMDTLKLLGNDRKDSLFMLSRDNESSRGLSTMAPG